MSKDGTVMCMFLCFLINKINFPYVFTDTVKILAFKILFLIVCNSTVLVKNANNILFELDLKEK